MARIRLDSVSMGKGFVEYHVHYPPVARRKRGLDTKFDDLGAACAAVKSHCSRDEVEPETAALCDEHAADVSWGAGAATA